MADTPQKPRFVCHPDGTVEDSRAAARSLPNRFRSGSVTSQPGFFKMTPGRRELLGTSVVVIGIVGIYLGQITLGGPEPGDARPQVLPQAFAPSGLSPSRDQADKLARESLQKWVENERQRAGFMKECDVILSRTERNLTVIQGVMSRGLPSEGFPKVAEALAAMRETVTLMEKRLETFRGQQLWAEERAELDRLLSRVSDLRCEIDALPMPD